MKQSDFVKTTDFSGQENKSHSGTRFVSLSPFLFASSKNVPESAFETSHDRVKGRQGDTSLVVLQAMQGRGINANPLGEIAVRKVATFFLQKTGKFLVQNCWRSHLDRVPAKVLPMGNTLLDVAYRQRYYAAP